MLEKNLKHYRHLTQAFIGKSYFNNDGEKLYLILQLLYYTLKRLDDTEKVMSWKCKGSPLKNVLLLPTLIIFFHHQVKWYEKRNFGFNISRKLIKTKNAILNPSDMIIFLLL